MLVGLEKEFFLVNPEGVPVALVDDLLPLPADECNWLVEARGKPFDSVIEAVFSLHAATRVIELQLAKINEARKATSKPILSLVDTPVMRVPRDVLTAALRRGGKGPIRYQNFYGHQYHRIRHSEATAGVHVSVTNQRVIQSWKGDRPETQTVNVNFDWPRIFTQLDHEFADPIKQSKRLPGFYELKSDGRVEYRSLPANVDLDRLADVLQPLLT